VRLWPTILTVVLLAAAFSLVSALFSHDGVGTVEYVVGLALFAALLALAVRTGRRAFQRA
jgi:hypothetical protein